MIWINNDIQDDELRIIVRPTSRQEKSRTQRDEDRQVVHWYHILLIAIAIISVVSVIFLVIRSRNNAPADDFYETELSGINSAIEQSSLEVGVLGNYSDTLTAYTEHLTRTVNDITLHIYIPHNAAPSLSVGRPRISDEKIIFTAQAADIRADNKKINGAFVLAGEPLAWGLSKKGYVGIINGKITVGVAENSPLFEQATETGGYFFRQYALVDNGKIVENEPKGKSVRKAICDRGGEIMVIFSDTPESFHDFAQALVDFQIDNAVYLVGSDYSIGFYRDFDGNVIKLSEEISTGWKYENYIEWRKEI